ncbi:Hsp20/alpha crystallin family protein [Halosolutus halophilus]|uniref:Hsp20/alpha crystallin family protein n=1 Tax=Halosolutus halophilus TaxID=1552990 RepID=UPI0022351494|nr:Hsp20 family protein [Halosolutus halophilus]
MSFKDLGTSVGNAVYRQIGRANGHLQNQRPLPVDVLENETSYLVVFDAPGAEPEDVQVRYLSGTVRTRIDRFRKFHEGYEMRFPGRGMALDGEAELPDDAVVDPDAGTARLSETGTLSIEIPKRSSIDAEDTEEVAATTTDDDSGTTEVTIDD